MYFTKLKKLWDELRVLNPMTVCDCEVSIMYLERENENKLIQFLLGLSDLYEHVKNQILILDPLPSVNKAYPMVLRAEKQREVNIITEVMESNASATNLYEGRK